MDAEAVETIPSQIPSYLPRQETIPEPPLRAISEDPGVAPGPARTCVIEHFPIGCAGAPIAGPHEPSAVNVPTDVPHGESSWAPFHSQCDWEIARWAKMSGPSSTAFSKLLAIPEVHAPPFFIVALLTY